MTTLEMLPAIGSQVNVRFEQITVACTVRDAKYSYGRPRLLIEPKDGNGQQWVELSRITIEAQSQAMTRSI
jgi:hypothetical protein